MRCPFQRQGPSKALLKTATPLVIRRIEVQDVLRKSVGARGFQVPSSLRASTAGIDTLEGQCDTCTLAGRGGTSEDHHHGMQADERFGEAMDYDGEGFNSNWHWLLHPGASDTGITISPKVPEEK